MNTRRSGGMGGDKTSINEDSAGQKPRGVRPPSRRTPGIATQTTQSDDAGGNAPTRFSAATRVFGDETHDSTPSPQNGPGPSGTKNVKTRSMTGGKTQLAGAMSEEPEGGAQSAAVPVVANAGSASEDPVHAWLVIVDGPGKGHALTIGGGRSAIGRDTSQHISIDFGDGTISREKHSWVTFDARDGKFYLSTGDGRNLSYINDAPVLTSLPMENRDTILIGETTMIFISFCGDEFSW